MVFVPIIFILTSGCSERVQLNAITVEPMIYRTPVEKTSFTSKPVVGLTVTPSIPSTATFTTSPTASPIPSVTPTHTRTPTQQPTWAWYPPGYITAPILLYHHVADNGNGVRYFITQDDFRSQMKALHDWGYTSITTTTLVKAIRSGGELPSRPVVISFDDGYSDVFQNAFPIMQEYDFVGTIYLYVDRIGSSTFLSVGEIQSLVASGWEVGSHSMSHPDLTKDHSIVSYELQESRTALEQMTGEPVLSFAYPYGELDDYVTSKVRDSGYLSGMGLGLNYNHSTDSLFDLKRIEVYADYSFDEFTGLLPWSEQ